MVYSIFEYLEKLTPSHVESFYHICIKFAQGRHRHNILKSCVLREVSDKTLCFIINTSYSYFVAFHTDHSARSPSILLEPNVTRQNDPLMRKRKC